MSNEMVSNESSFENMKAQASILLKSGFLPASIKTAEQALAIMLVGRELGLGFMESLRSINVVQGRPCMSAQLLLALCHRTKEVEQAYFEVQSNTQAIFILKRVGSPGYRAVWDMDRAKSMVLDKKDNWIKQPKNMLSWRAISEAARMKFPDAICGIYTQDEAEDIIQDVETVQTEPEMPRAKVTESQKPEQEAVQEVKAPETLPESKPEPVKQDSKPTPAGYQMIKAIQDGKCKGCGHLIPKDSEFAFSVKKGSFHADCVT